MTVMRFGTPLFVRAWTIVNETVDRLSVPEIRVGASCWVLCSNERIDGQLPLMTRAERTHPPKASPARASSNSMSWRHIPSSYTSPSLGATAAHFSRRLPTVFARANEQPITKVAATAPKAMVLHIGVTFESYFN